MSEYRFLCPKCGHGFADGTSFNKCPRCQVLLLEAAPTWSANLQNLPEAVDLDELLRNALAEQRSGEEIDRAIARHVAATYPDAQQGLIEIVGRQLTEWQKIKTISRQAAVEEMAKSQSELTLGPDGRSEVRTELRSEMRIDGLEQLSPEMRQMALRQLEQMMRAGGGSGRMQIQGSIGGKRIGCGSAVLIAILASIAIWAI
jgi:hypothetical protein